MEESVPYDPKGGVVPNEGGRVVDHPWLYCAGWLATGPRGVIVDTMTAAYSVAQVHQPRLAFSHSEIFVYQFDKSYLNYVLRRPNFQSI